MTKPADLANSVNSDSIPGDRLAPGAVTDPKVSGSADIDSAKLLFTGDQGALSRTVEDRLLDAQINVMDFIPESEHAAIRNGTTTADLTSYIQAAFDAGVASGQSFELHFPSGVYRAQQILLGEENTSKGARVISLTGSPQGTRLISLVASGVFLKVPKFWGYGAGSDWLFRDLLILSGAAGNNTGLYFEALNWNTRLQNCVFSGFNTNARISSSISLYVDTCRFGNAAVHGLLLDRATTGLSGLDEPASNGRIANCNIYNNAYGVTFDGSGRQQMVIRDNIFENNTTYALQGMGDMSLVDGNWFEGVNDVINGEYAGVTFSNNIGIASVPSSPLFTNSGASFDPATNNQCIRFNTGEFNNRYYNFIRGVVCNTVRGTTQFQGVGKSFASTTALSYSELLQDASGNFFSGAYSAYQPQAQLLALSIYEKNSGVDYTYPATLVTFDVDPGGINPWYICAASSTLAPWGGDISKLESSITSTRFWLYRDGATGNLGIAWENKNASTTDISFTVRPVANFGPQLF